LTNLGKRCTNSFLKFEMSYLTDIYRTKTELGSSESTLMCSYFSVQLSHICLLQLSGLSAEIGNFLGERFARLPVMALIIVCSICAAALTEFTSNAATASILLPIMFSLVLHPFMLAFPATIGTSFAFSLPAATPPNSIVFGKGRVRVKDMVRLARLVLIVRCYIPLIVQVGINVVYNSSVCKT
uniref:CitMHS domain-containing protein n=1 Tax=Echinostoma caproni TaxID=27848 RepID=A0A183A0K3_9TREM